jgi:Fe-S-cluster containining protein
MIISGEILLSDELFENKFVCDLGSCKGACCVAGDSGAPLEPEETMILEEIFEQVKPYMNEEGIKTIEKRGLWETDEDGDLVTPLVGGVGACAFVIYENGIAKCSIEKAYLEGKVSF